MSESWHGVGTVALLFLATEPIELAPGGGLGCPERGAGENKSEAL